MRFILSVFLTAMTFMTLQASDAHAQMSIIRDEEIERTLESWIEPLLAAQNMESESVQIILVESPDINAFVAGGANIFIYTGLIERTESPGEVIGVLAHELGHIAGGHLVRGRDAMKNASYETLLGTLLGIGVAVATGKSEAAGAIAAGTQSMAQRKYLAHSRVEEASADQSALTTLERAKMNPSGFHNFMEKLGSEELMTSDKQSEYVRSHPLTRNRLSAIEAGIERSSFAKTEFPKNWNDQHARMKAKLLGYMHPGHIDWRYDPRDTSIAADYARAIAAYRDDRIEDALVLIDRLIEREIDNPFFHELKGQALVEFGRLEQGITSYRAADRYLLKKKSPLVSSSLGHALSEYSHKLQEPKKTAALREAITHFQSSLAIEPNSTGTQHQIALAYGYMGQKNLAELHLAFESMLRRDYTVAIERIEKVQHAFPEKSREWLMVQDVLHYSQQAQSQKMKEER